MQQTYVALFYLVLFFFSKRDGRKRCLGRNNTRKKKRNLIYFLWHLNRNPKENKKKEHTERQLQAPFVFVFVFVFVFACMLLVIAILRVDRTREKKKTGRRT